MRLTFLKELLNLDQMLAMKSVQNLSGLVKHRSTNSFMISSCAGSLSLWWRPGCYFFITFLILFVNPSAISRQVVDICCVTRTRHFFLSLMTIMLKILFYQIISSAFLWKVLIMRQNWVSEWFSKFCGVLGFIFMMFHFCHIGPSMSFKNSWNLAYVLHQLLKKALCKQGCPRRLWIIFEVQVRHRSNQ